MVTNSSVTIMGILNITPDSFSDGGLYYDNVEKAVSRALRMVQDGADIIDVGGESTRPGSKQVPVEEELERVLPVLDAIREELGEDIPISIDTYKAPVAREALAHGATVVNSMGGLRFDPELANVVKDANCQIVIYHIKGSPQTMQTGEIVYDDVIAEITQFFEEQIDFGIEKGLRREQFIIDPGIGFGKTVGQNLEIIRRLDELEALQLPILIGVSRKSHLGMLLKEKLNLDDLPVDMDRLEASLAETAVSVIQGAHIIRTHDVAETKRFVTILEELI